MAHPHGGTATEMGGGGVSACRGLVLRGIDTRLALHSRSLKFQMSVAEGLRSTRFRASFRSHTNDIVIATYPKSGTTWVQMILFQLLTKGAMDEVPHLNSFAPYLEDLVKGIAHPSRATNPAEAAPVLERKPWIFKTHARYRDVPTGCGRYIYVIRDGRDVVVSFYHHFRRNGYNGTFPEFFKEFIQGTLRFGTWFDHVNDWVRNPAHLKILYLRFEDMIADLPAAIRKIANFCAVQIDENEMPRITRNCSFDFMRTHEAKLDVNTRRRREIEPENDHFVRKGRVGEWAYYFNQEMEAAYVTSYAQRVGAESPLLEAYRLDHLVGAAVLGASGGAA